MISMRSWGLQCSAVIMAFSSPTAFSTVDVVARRARQIADEAEETGEHLTEKPVTLAIQEVADGKLDARNMDLTIEEPEDLQPAEEEAQ